MKKIASLLIHAMRLTCVRRPSESYVSGAKFKGWVGTMILLVVTHVTLQGTLNAGQVLAYSFHSQTLGRDWPYNAYLPEGYDHSNLRYPVLFMLHGYSENENAWVSKGRINEAADHLIAAGDISPVVIIMPGSGDNWYVDLKEKIETAFIQDFIPEVERTFESFRNVKGGASAVILWEVTVRSGLS